jgi:hypothetical protein
LFLPRPTALSSPAASGADASTGESNVRFGLRG